MGFVDNVRSAAGKIGPITLGLVAGFIVVSAAGVLDEYKHANLVAMTSTWMAHPWTILTYPFISVLGDALSVLFFLCLLSWTVWAGGTIERDLGSLRYGILWIVSTVLPALFIVIGGAVLGLGTGFGAAGGPLLPISAVTVVWGFRNRSAAVMMFALLPLNGFWVAILSGVIVFVQYAHPPLLAIFACLHLFVAWAYAIDRIPGLRYAGAATNFTKYKPSKAQIRKEENFFDDVRKREKERDERERLRKLFEASFDEDDKK